MRLGSPSLGYYAPRLGLMVAAIYVAMLAGEVTLWSMQPREVLMTMGRGLYVAEDGHVSHKPGARTRFDDGYARGEIVVNSLGHRDREPGGDGADRVLLVGDSMAFGALLDQQDTIDVQLERLSAHRDVVNLGVNGYNLPQQLEPLRRWTLPARHVVYLFHENDLDGTFDQAIVDGYRVQSRRPDGTARSEAEMRALVAMRLDRFERSIRLSWDALLLPRVSRMMRNVVPSATNGVRDGFRDEAERALAVDRGVKATEEMRSLAMERRMTFHLVLAPSIREAQARAYQPAVARYTAALAARGVTIVDLLPHLSPDDYWRHDGHFNPRGASVAARAIDAALREGH